MGKKTTDWVWVHEKYPEDGEKCEILICVRGTFHASDPEKPDSDDQEHFMTNNGGSNDSEYTLLAWKKR